MALPIIEQIIADLVTAIESVTTGNGYAITVAAVHQPATIADINRTPPVDYTVQLIQDDPIPNPEYGYSSNPPRVGWDQPLQLDLIFRPSDTAATPLQKQLNIFEAELIKAIMADPQRAGLAIDTTVSPSTWWANTDDGTAGKTLTLTISYRHKENDPTSP